MTSPDALAIVISKLSLIDGIPAISRRLMPMDLRWLTFEFTGVARIYRAASGGMMGWAA